MARIDVPAQDTPGGYIEDGVVLTGTVSDPDGYELDLTGREMIIVQNTSGVGTAITFVSVDNVRGRQGDIVATIPAGETGIFGPFSIEGWQQVDGKLNADYPFTQFVATNIRLPSQFRAGA